MAVEQDNISRAMHTWKVPKSHAMQHTTPTIKLYGHCHIVCCREKDWGINVRDPSVVRRGGLGARPVISPRPRHGRSKH